jgi:hypothetical protein
MAFGVGIRIAGSAFFQWGVAEWVAEEADWTRMDWAFLWQSAFLCVPLER